MSEKAANGRSVLPQDAVEELVGMLWALERSGVRGDVLEAGSFKAGTAVEMAKAAPGRRVYAHDAFGDGSEGTWNVDYEEVKAYVAPYRNVHLVRGRHEETVPRWKGELALALLDSDSYRSTLVCLRHLAPMISPGGAFVIDDWSMQEIQDAVRDAFDALTGFEREDMPSGLVVYRKTP